MSDVTTESVVPKTGLTFITLDLYPTFTRPAFTYRAFGTEAKRGRSNCLSRLGAIGFER